MAQNQYDLPQVRPLLVRQDQPILLVDRPVEAGNGQGRQQRTYRHLGVDDDRAIASEHFAYLERAAADVVVVLAGRSQDGIGPAIVIIEVHDEGAARRFMSNDPFISSGLFRANLHPFRAALMRRS